MLTHSLRWLNSQEFCKHVLIGKIDNHQKRTKWKQLHASSEFGNDPYSASQTICNAIGNCLI